MENKKDIPVVILLGGNGANLGKNGENIPKALVPILGKPLLEYILEQYIDADFCKFIFCAGKGIKEFQKFATDYQKTKNISIQVVDTGVMNKTGSRIAQTIDLVKDYPYFALTYGDTYSNVDINALFEAHIHSQKIATLLAVNNPTRFRILGLFGNDNEVRGFANKPILEKDFINGGFYFLNTSVFELNSLSKDVNCTFENEVLEELIQKRELNSFKHYGIWRPIDCERDVNTLSAELKNQR
jgi:glucose-1-phosphate cytidylyltransferase